MKEVDLVLYGSNEQDSYGAFFPENEIARWDAWDAADDDASFMDFHYRIVDVVQAADQIMEQSGMQPDDWAAACPVLADNGNRIDGYIVRDEDWGSFRVADGRRFSVISCGSGFWKWDDGDVTWLR